MYNLECVDCGMIVEYRVKMSKPRCPECRKKRNNARVQDWKDKNKEYLKQYYKNRSRKGLDYTKTRPVLQETDSHKECGDCKELLPKSAFDKYSNHDKLKRNCRQCTKAYHSRYRFKQRLCTTKQ